MSAWRERPSSDRRILWAGPLFALRVLLAVLAAGPGFAETRAALVIGNSDYGSLSDLKNPANDAVDVAAALEGLGFEVMVGTDLSRQQMADLVSRFVRVAREANVSLFYYAGHGFQLEQANYLVPIDAALQRRDAIPAETIRLDQITEALEGSPGIHLVFLDACRNNPLPAGTTAAQLPLRDGLARIGDAAGFLFAFATQPDNVAYDGVGRNSFFTRALLGHLPTPGQDIASMMIEVRKDVLAATGGKQVPWENSSLTRQFAFVPGEPAASPETVLWQIAATSQDPKLLHIYLERYADGAHAADAREMLARIEMAGLAEDSEVQTRNTGLVPDTAQLADSLWQIAQRTRMRPLVEAYLDQAPDGPHAAEAHRLLALLPPPEAEAATPEHRCEYLATHVHDGTAQVDGVPMQVLARHAPAAQEACRTAVAAHPELPHYTALLARATYAAGDRQEAAALYRNAADRGDLRAMFSLARMLESGDGIPKDVSTALVLYERSAAGGNADSAINLAVALFNGAGIAPDPARAKELLAEAAADGSAIATRNLGALAERDGAHAEALELFRKAAELGDTQAHVPAAILLDEGRGVPQDPEGAADHLLRGVASDYGEAMDQLTNWAADWHSDTIAAIQSRLQTAGFYDGAVDGIRGPMFDAALRRWRNGGALVSVATTAP